MRQKAGRGKNYTMRTTTEILEEIGRFTPENGNWLGLEVLLAELWKSRPSQEWVNPLLAVFERFPDEDGAGVMWSIIHGLETIEGYEPILEESAQARPTWLKSAMLKRIANAKKHAPNQ